MQTPNLSIFALLDALEQGGPSRTPSAIEKQTFSEAVAGWGYEWEGDDF